MLASGFLPSATPKGSHDGRKPLVVYWRGATERFSAIPQVARSTLALIQGKYKMVILYCLMEFQPVRFNEPRRYLKTVSDKTLSRAPA